MKRLWNLTLPTVATILLLSTAGSPAQGFTQLHAFGANTNIATDDGADTSADLVLSGGTLYGTAKAGGTTGHGTIFSLDTNGGNFTVLYNFTNGFDGGLPAKHLVLAGDTLYGTAGVTNSSGGGEIFSLNTNGNGFAVLYTLNASSDGSGPGPGLVLGGDTLYGSANEGGGNSRGTLFSINTNGSGFTVIHTFSGAADGQNPNGGLVLSGDTLYGTARNGGQNGSGTIFSIKTNSSSFTVLHPFSGHTNQDAGLPEGALAFSGGTLYGTTFGGGTNGFGTVYSINTDASGYQVLRSFTRGTDGGEPEGGVTLAGDMLYGTTIEATNNGGGVVFALGTNGGSFTTLHAFSFANGSFGFTNADGWQPFGALVFAGSTLYGTTQQGGTNGTGTVFAQAILPSFTSLKLNGSNAVFNAINGLAGHSYTLLTSTNILSPRNQWTPLVTNVPASGGNFVITATNAASPARASQFYLLRTQ